MIPAISPRDRRALLLGGALLVGLMIITRGVPTVRAWQSGAISSAAELSTEAARARRSVASIPEVSDSVAARRERYLALAPLLLNGGVNGDTPAAAGAALVALVSGAAAESGVRLAAVQIRERPMRADTSLAGMFLRVRVHADASGDVAGVTRFLLALERGPARLRIPELSIAQPEPAAAPDRPEALRVTLVIEGLALRARAGRSR